MRVNPLNQLGIPTQAVSLVQVQEQGEKPENTFVQMLKGSIHDVNQLQSETDKAIENLATGRTKDIAQVMIKAEEAQIAFQFLIQVRNKAIEAYNEIIRMPV